MLTFLKKAGSTDVSVVIRIIDSTDGTPETGVVYNTSGIDLQYRREGATSTAITEATLSGLDSAHSDGGILHIGNGYYRLDLPDAAVAAGASGVLVHGTVTGMVVIGCYVSLVAVDFGDGVRFGMTALPNAAAEAAGGLYTRGTGAGQINQPANGQIDANAKAVGGTTQTGGDIPARLGAITGSGDNTVLGFFKALLSKSAATPSDIGGTFLPSTDSTEAIRERGDLAWTSGAGQAATSAYVPSGDQVVNIGSHSAGSYTDLTTVNGVYLVVDEATPTNPGMDFYIPVMTAAGKKGVAVKLWCYYSGNASHWIRVMASVDGSTSSWEEIGTIANGSAVTPYTFALSSQHIKADGTFYVRFLHNAVAGVATHKLYLDKLIAETVDAVQSVTVASGGIVAASFASGALDAVWSTASRTLTAATNITADIATAVWAAATRTLTAISDSSGITTLLNRISDTFANLFNAQGLTTTRTAKLDNADVATSTRLATSGYTAPANGDITSIKAVTDKVDTLIENSSGYRFTTKALEQGPAASGGLTSGDVEQIRHRLVIDGTATAPTAPTASPSLPVVLAPAAAHGGSDASLTLGQGASITGAGVGLDITGSNGPAIRCSGNNDSGVQIMGTGHALDLYAGNGNGIHVQCNTEGNGIRVVGAGLGRGIHVSGGDEGAGALIEGGTTAGEGVFVRSLGGSSDAVYLSGNGSGAGLSARGGTTGRGIRIRGGSSSGNGLEITTTNGDGAYISASGSGKFDINAPNSDIGSSVDAAAIAAAVRDVNNDTPAADSLGEKINTAAAGGVNIETLTDALVIAAPRAGIAMESTLLHGIETGTVVRRVSTSGRITLVRGDVEVIIFRLGTDNSLTGRTAKLTVRKFHDKSLVLDGATLTTVDAANGVCTYTTGTNTFAEAGRFVFDVEVSDTADGAAPRTAQIGTLIVLDDVNGI